MNGGALDRWITGNWGYDHPDNNPPEMIDCESCGDRCDFPPDRDPDSTAYFICEDCEHEGMFVCPWCGEIGDGTESETGTARALCIEIKGERCFEIICVSCFTAHIIETGADPYYFLTAAAAREILRAEKGGS